MSSPFKISVNEIYLAPLKLSNNQFEAIISSILVICALVPAVPRNATTKPFTGTATVAL